MKPNIVFIMADELRSDICLHENYPFVKTPNLDWLRREGATFTNAFCQTPTCCPSRGSAMTGKYPQELGLYNHSCGLAPEERTMGHHFADHGYDSAAFGKTHNMNPGFTSHTYDIRATMGSTNHGYNVTDEDAVGAFEGDTEEFCDFVAIRQFHEYLASRDATRPFLAFVGLYSPHPPLYPPVEYATMYDPRDIELPPHFEEEAATKPAAHETPRYRWRHLQPDTQRKIIATVLGMTTLVDDCVGRILASLRQHGLAENTIVVFTSDHGDQMGEHMMLGKFFNTYEGSLRVPLFMRLPITRGDFTESAGATSSTIPPGSHPTEQARHAGHAPTSAAPGPTSAVGVRFDQLVELVDLYPTICELTDVPTPEGPHSLSGTSLLPLVAGAATDHKPYVFSMIEHAHMVRTDRYKLVQSDEDTSELYDLAEDPAERYNRYGDRAYRDVMLELETELVRHLIRHRPANHHPVKNGFFG